MKKERAPLGCRLVGAKIRRPKPRMASLWSASQSVIEQRLGGQVDWMRSLVSFGMAQKVLVSDSSVSSSGIYGCQLPETTASIRELSPIPRGFPSLAAKISSVSKACLLVPKSDLKTARGASPSWVRIPPLPPNEIEIA